MAIDWSDLRLWNGSRDNAFEELCCQLASNEAVPDGSQFFRKGTPDAGVECYWKVPNGDELGWQAKYFRESPGPTQWRQLSESVETALEKHPRLTEYYVCLPQNLSDARVGKQVTAAKKWDTSVAAWTKVAESHGMKVEFILWNESLIGNRLSREENRGRWWFWFNSTRLSRDWFEGRINEAVENARDRFSRDVNVSLPINDVFPAVGRTPAFRQRLLGMFEHVLSKTNELRPESLLEFLGEPANSLKASLKSLDQTLRPLLTDVPGYEEWNYHSPFDWETVEASIDNMIGAVEDARCFCLTVTDGNSAEGVSSRRDIDKAHRILYRLGQLNEALHEWWRFLDSSLPQVANGKPLLISGEAGQGKTHLLCNAALESIGEGSPSLLFHGEQFVDGEPWSQMIALLGLDCSREEFLGGLEAAGQASSSRVILFLDALNEGDGATIWYRSLPGIIATLRRYSWLSLCVSVRNDYRRIIVPQTLDSALSEVVHTGFSDIENRGAEYFFNAFGIEPSAPLLAPEFHNPLFLKLFCQSIRNRGETRVPLGIQGITSILEFFLDAIDQKVCRPEHLDCDPRDRPVAEAVRLLSQRMAEVATERLPINEAKHIVNSVLASQSHEKSLFRYMESEGVITSVYHFLDDTESARFTFQRFSDHLITTRLMDQHPSLHSLTVAFGNNGSLRELFKDRRSAHQNAGILQALAVQVPEKFAGVELASILPHLADESVLPDAVRKSLPWRSTTSFSAETDFYINEHLNGEGLWDTMISLTTMPGHPLNAEQLDAYLRKFNMPDRDAFWAVFLHKYWQRDMAVKRLIDWAWSDSDKSHFDDEVILLAGITLVWFLSASNREIRDQATKALVNLLRERLSVLRQLVARMQDIDDCYVTERLYAVAYGCVLRSGNDSEVQQLAEDVYLSVFASGSPPVHLLLRDYARGVVETAVRRRQSFSGDLEKVRPPYGSHWPELDELPTEESVSQYSGFPFYDSLTDDWNDFNKNVINDLGPWHGARIGELRYAYRRDDVEAFRKTLTERQAESFDELIDILTVASGEDRHELSNAERSWLWQLETIVAFEDAFLKRLRWGTKKHSAYVEIRDFIPEAAWPTRVLRFPLQRLCFWMVQRVAELGWTPKRFAKFDDDSFHEPKVGSNERIGMKYQWLAFRELQARLADNFELEMDCSDDGESGFIYDGPWQVRQGRDIDPSLLIRRSEGESWFEANTPCWWFNLRYGNDWEEQPFDQWIVRTDDIPNPRSLICAEGQAGTKWVSLVGSYTLQQPAPLGDRSWLSYRKDISYGLQSHFVHKSEVNVLSDWIFSRDFGEFMMPSAPSSSSDIALGEFFDSPAFHCINQHYYGREGWTQGSDDYFPVPVLPATDAYFQEQGYDRSFEDSIRIGLPCELLSNVLDLRLGAEDGVRIDKRGRPTVIDPSVYEQGPQTVLIREDALFRFLDETQLELILTVQGEKRVIGGLRHDRQYVGHAYFMGVYLALGEEFSGRFETAVRQPKKSPK